MVADKLTKQAKFLYEPKIWLEDIHSDPICNFWQKFFVLLMNFPDWFLQKKKKKKKFSKILRSTGAFRDSGVGVGVGAGAGLGNFWKKWVRVWWDSAIKKLLKIYL